MKRTAYSLALQASVAIFALVVNAAPAAAQDTVPPATGDTTTTAAAPNPRAAAAASDQTAMDIVVTARKRSETVLDTPVIVSALSEQQLQQVPTVDIKDLPRLVPGLLIGSSILSVGQLVSIRGVGTSSFDPGIDQSVSLNIDGLPLGQGLAYSSGLFDVGHVEVLKGPQALFFGKGSPGGVISMRTADPTDKTEIIARAGYEAEAETRRGELIVSGPIVGNLKGRLAGVYSASEGYYFNEATALPGTGAVDPHFARTNRSRDYQIRGTLLWNPDYAFDARLKVNLVHDRAVDPDQFQMTSCPEGIASPVGIPFIGSGEDCKKDRVTRIVDLDPKTNPGILNNGIPFVDSKQLYGTLELNYRPADALTLTSVTGFYRLISQSLLNTTFSSFAGPAFNAQNPRFFRRDVTEEVRLASDFSTPINFTVGGFFQDGAVSNRVTIIGNSAYGLPPLIQDGLNRFSISTYSAFGQLRWEVFKGLELSGGGRWTDETREQNPLLYPSAGLAVTAPLVVTPRTPRIHASNFAPEFTIRYKPTDDLMLFAAYKQGFKSGSFSIATPAKLNNPVACLAGTAPCDYLDNAFNDEQVQGGEVGIKGALFNRRFTFSLAGFDYGYTGLQVGAIEPVVGTTPTIRTVNAGSGRAYGAELEVAYRPEAIERLTLNGTANWTHARFDVLNNVPCVGGQTVAQGCNQSLDPVTGLYFAQDLSGTPFVRAPDWQASLGFNYDMPLKNGWTLSLNNSNRYSSRYLTTLGRRADFYQEGFVKIDLGLTLRSDDERYEVSLSAKNVTERLTTSSCSNSNFAAGSLGGQITGGTTSGPAGTDEVGCYMDSGREIWLRVTFRPFGKK